MDTIIARKMHRTLEAYHGMIYFVPEAVHEYEVLGAVDGLSGYFASRAAPMGAVTPEVVTATFFNFNPDYVESAMVGVWDLAPPEAWLAARMSAADVALRTHLKDHVGGPEIARAAELARTAAAGCWAPGRPLAAGLLHLDWPDEPHLVLWHGIALLREFRGDGHVAALVAGDVSPCEALLLHAGTGEIPAASLKATHAWPDEPWDHARTRLEERCLIDSDGHLTDAGTAFREDIEIRTDQAAMAPWETLGKEGSDELRGLVRPFSRMIVDSGVFGA